MEKEFDLNLLRVLVALDKHKNVTRAAQALDMSQSGFSTALARLRDRIGDPLFVRTQGGMEATPRAQSMVNVAKSILTNVQSSILEQPTFDPQLAQIEYRLAMADVAEVVFLPQLLAHLSREAPHVRLRSDPWPRGELLHAMETGQVDLALGYFPDLSSDSIFKQRLYTHTYACIVRPGHWVLKRFTLTSYGELGHAVVNTPSRSDELFEHFLARKGMTRKIVLRTPHHLSLPDIIASTDLIATVPLATATRFAATTQVEVLPLPFKPPRFDVQQYWHRRSHHDPRVRWLQHTISSLFNDGTDSWKSLEQKLY
jgi:DNA-binding transcriptional LysR family regulator